MLQMDDASIGYCIFVPTTRNKLWKHNLTTARVQTCLQHSFNNFLFFHYGRSSRDPPYKRHPPYSTLSRPLKNYLSCRLKD